MRENFPTALRLVLKHEGGFVNHPRDPGGATKYGITQRTLADWRSRRGTRHTISAEDVRTLSHAEAAAIYRANYWDAIRGDDLPAGIDYALFDFAVNSGPYRAAGILQRILRYFGSDIAQDGKIGPETLGALDGITKSETLRLIDALCQDRLSYLHTLSTFATFGKGWTRRVTECQLHAEQMARDATTQTTITAPAPKPDATAAQAPTSTALGGLISRLISTIASIFGRKPS